jgi:hypothetical protein
MPGGGQPSGGGSSGGAGSTGDAGTTSGSSGGAGSAGGGAGSAGGTGGGAGSTDGAGGADGGAGTSASGSGGEGTGTAQTEAPARTPEEQRAAVDQRLDASLEKFDEELRREQQQTAQQRDARAGSQGTGSGSVVEDVARSDSEGLMARNRAGDLRSEGAGSDPGEGGEGGSGDSRSSRAMTGGGGGVSAREIPSGEDDDIIARRLRKAAETETDPELKDKLWKEYIDYKQNTQGR